MNEVQERLRRFINYLNISVSQFEQSVGVGNAFVKNTNNRMRKSSKNLISQRYPQLNIDWLMRGKGQMLNDSGEGLFNDDSEKMIQQTREELNSSKTAYDSQRKKIPFYDDVCMSGDLEYSIGGTKNYSMIGYFDTGDWFKEATSAIRNHGDSMVEYPRGAILVLKRVQDINLLIWGRNYCVETTEIKIIKRLQDGGKDYIIGHSTNLETYPDGTLIHSPIKIPRGSVKQIDLVLGCVIKEYSDNDL